MSLSDPLLTKTCICPLLSRRAGQPKHALRCIYALCRCSSTGHARACSPGQQDPCDGPEGELLLLWHSGGGGTARFAEAALALARCAAGATLRSAANTGKEFSAQQAKNVSMCQVKRLLSCSCGVGALNHAELDLSAWSVCVRVPSWADTGLPGQTLAFLGRHWPSWADTGLPGQTLAWADAGLGRHWPVLWRRCCLPTAGPHKMHVKMDNQACVIGHTLLMHCSWPRCCTVQGRRGRSAAEGTDKDGEVQIDALGLSAATPARSGITSSRKPPRGRSQIYWA